MSLWRKKPVTVEAFRWTGGIDQTEDPEWIVDAIREGIVRFDMPCTPDCPMCGGEGLIFDDPEGEGRVCPRCFCNQ